MFLTLLPMANNLWSYFVVEYHSKSLVNRHLPKKLLIGRQQQASKVDCALLKTDVRDQLSWLRRGPFFLDCGLTLEGKKGILCKTFVIMPLAAPPDLTRVFTSGFWLLWCFLYLLVWSGIFILGSEWFGMLRLQFFLSGVWSHSGSSQIKLADTSSSSISNSSLSSSPLLMSSNSVPPPRNLKITIKLILYHNLLNKISFCIRKFE